jgi:hypothetical protein
VATKRPRLTSQAIGAKCGFACIDMKSNFMNTAFLLMAQYRGKAIVPIEDVCRDYFSHVNPTNLIQKISAGDIAIPGANRNQPEMRKRRPPYRSSQIS